MKRNKVVKSLNNSNKNKMKTKATNLQNSNGEPFYLQNERGVVGVPTNGDLLGEPVISVCLPEG